MKLVAYILILFYPTFQILSQEVIGFDDMKVVYEKMDKFYSQDNYKMDVKYSSFKGHYSNKAEDVMSGYIIKSGEIIESYQMGIYSIQNSEYKLVIDSSEQSVGVIYPDTSKIQITSSEQFELSKKYVESISISKRGRDDKFVLVYRSGYQFSKMEMLVSQEGILKEIQLFFANNIEYQDEEGDLKKDKAKVIIEFEKTSYSGLNIDINNIVTNDKGELRLSSQFKNYELIDYRYQN